MLRVGLDSSEIERLQAEVDDALVELDIELLIFENALVLALNLPAESGLLNLDSVVQIDVLIGNYIMLTDMLLNIPCNLIISHELPDGSIKYRYFFFALLIFLILLILASLSFYFLHILVLFLLNLILNWLYDLLAYDLENLVLDRRALLEYRRVIDDT